MKESTNKLGLSYAKLGSRCASKSSFTLISQLYLVLNICQLCFKFGLQGAKNNSAQLSLARAELSNRMIITGDKRYSGKLTTPLW
jgi:hypothetical protein